MKHKAAFLSTTDEWSTPQKFFDEWNATYQFTLDVAATSENTKCTDFYTREDDGLSQQWRGSVWCNPPYGRDIGKWVQKAYESATGHTRVVMLIPARTDTRWWNDYVARSSAIWFIKGRLKFGGSSTNAPFPSCVVLFSGMDHRGKPDVYFGEPSS